MPIHFDADIGAQHTALFEQGGPISRTVTGVDVGNGYGNGAEKYMNENMARSGIANYYHGARFKREKVVDVEVNGVKCSGWTGRCFETGCSAVTKYEIPHILNGRINSLFLISFLTLYKA